MIILIDFLFFLWLRPGAKYIANFCNRENLIFLLKCLQFLLKICRQAFYKLRWWHVRNHLEQKTVWYCSDSAYAGHTEFQKKDNGISRSCILYPGNYLHKTALELGTSIEPLSMSASIQMRFTKCSTKFTAPSILEIYWSHMGVWVAPKISEQW